MRYSIKRGDGTTLVPGITLAEASSILATRVNDRGETGEVIAHDPVYPLFVSDERSSWADYTLYTSLDDMLARAPRASQKVRLNTSDEGKVMTVSLIDIRSDPPLIKVGMTLRGVTDIVAFETVLETAASLKDRGVA